MLLPRLPTAPGRYFWDEWGREVDIYSRGGSEALWVKVFPHWRPLKITPRIAGRFTKVEEKVNASIPT